MHVVAVLMLQAAVASAVLPSSFDLDRLRPAPTLLAGGCDASGDASEIRVCGRRRDRFRLPLPTEPADPDAHVAGEAPGGAAVLVPAGRCGIFAGEHGCSKAEAAAYGYGAGRDPVTLVARLGAKILDPDGD